MITINKMYSFSHFIAGYTPIMLTGTLLTFLSNTLNFQILGFTAGSLIVLLLFITLDFITGVSKSLKNGKSINSKQGRESVYKLIGYAMSILLLAVLEMSLSTVNVPAFGIYTVSLIRNFLLAMMLFWEFHSVGENIEEIYGEKPKVFYFVEILIQKMEARVMIWLENLFKIEKKETSENTDVIQ